LCMAHHATLLAVYVILQHFGSAGSDSLQSRYTGAATEAVHHEMTEQVRQPSFRGGLRLRGGSRATRSWVAGMGSGEVAHNHSVYYCLHWCHCIVLLFWHRMGASVGTVLLCSLFFLALCVCVCRERERERERKKERKKESLYPIIHVSACACTCVGLIRGCDVGCKRISIETSPGIVGPVCSTWGVGGKETESKQR
jgi:hypothetical protein